MLCARSFVSSCLVAGLAVFAGACRDGGRSRGSPPSLSTPPVVTPGNPSPAPSVPAVFRPIGFTTLEQGSQSLRLPAQSEQILATDAASWLALWASHSPSAAPSVDFAQSSVVAAFLPERAEEQAVEVVRVESDSAGGPDLRVTLREFRQGPWRAAQSPTSPAHLLQVRSVGAGGALHVLHQRRLDFEVLDAGSQSAIGSGQVGYLGEIRVIRSDTALVSFWAQHAPGGTPPAVSFASEMVVAVLAGFYPTFGHTIDLERIVWDATQNEVRVHYDVLPYSGGAAPPAVTETPYLILRVALAPGMVRRESTTDLTRTPLHSTSFSLHAGGQEVLIIRDDANFQALWTQRFSGPAPSVDFTRDQVIAAFLGQQTSGGHSVAVQRARLLEDGELEILVTTQAPFGPGAGVITSPADLVTVPRGFGPFSFETKDVTPVP